MLPNRPSPSAPALRLLRQVAYISSGTVCGAGVVLHEERRRRIRTAEKIKEQARKLRESPRHVDSRALHTAVATVEEQVPWIPPQPAAQVGGLEVVGSVRGDCLPSEVEKSYGRMQVREYKGKRRRVLTEGLGGQEGEAGFGGQEAYDRQPSRRAAMPRSQEQYTAKLSPGASTWGVERRGISSARDVFAIPEQDQDTHLSEYDLFGELQGPAALRARDAVNDQHQPEVEKSWTADSGKFFRVDVLDQKPDPPGLHDTGVAECKLAAGDYTAVGDIERQSVPKYNFWKNDGSQEKKLVVRMKKEIKDGQMSSAFHKLLRISELTGNTAVPHPSPVKDDVATLQKEDTVSTPSSFSPFNAGVALERSQVPAKLNRSINEAMLRIGVAKEVDVAVIEGAVNIFLELFPYSTVEKGPQKPLKLASMLEVLATAAGLKDKTHSLHLWLRSREHDDPVTVDATLQACRRLLEESQVVDALNMFLLMLSKETDAGKALQRLIRKSKGLELVRQLYDAAAEGALFVHTHSLFGLMTSINQARSLLSNKCRNLIAQGRTREAVALFFVCLGSKHDPNASAQYSELVRHLSRAACTSGLLSETKRILEWTILCGTPNRLCMRDVISTAADIDAFENIVALHQKYLSNEELTDPRERANICKAYAFAAPLAVATDFIVAFKPEPRETKRLQMTYATLVGRTWKETKNFDRVESLFRQLSEAGTPDALGVKSYNSMIMACVESGRPEEAQHYLREMEEHNLMPDVKTYGHLMLANALDGYWIGVDTILRRVYENGMMDTLSHGCGPFFNEVLREYTRSHSAAETQVFVAKAISNYDLVPDQTTLDTVLGCFVKEKRLHLIPKWLRYLRSEGFSLRVNARSATVLFRRFCVDHRPCHLQVMRLSGRLRAWAKDLVSREFFIVVHEAVAYDVRKVKPSLENDEQWRKTVEQRLNAVDRIARTVPSLADIAKQEQVEVLQQTPTENLPALPTWSQPSDSTATNLGLQSLPQEAFDDLVGRVEPGDTSSLSAAVVAPEQTLPGYRQVKQTSKRSSVPRLGQSTRADDQRKTDSDIVLALSLNRPTEAVALYRQSLSVSGLPNSALSLEVAVESSLQASFDSIDEAMAMVYDAQAAGMNICNALGPLIRHRMKTDPKQQSKPKDLRHTVLEFYRLMDANRIPVKHYIAVSAADLLVKQRKPTAAIDLLTEIYQSEWARKRPFDIAAMTVFLRAYAAKRYMPGIRWVLETVRAKDMRIDSDLIRTLKNVRYHFRKGVEKETKKASGFESETQIAEHRDAIDQLNKWRIYYQCRKRQQTRQTAKLGDRLIEILSRESAIPASVGRRSGRLSKESRIVTMKSRRTSSLVGAPEDPFSRTRTRRLIRQRLHQQRHLAGPGAADRRLGSKHPLALGRPNGARLARVPGTAVYGPSRRRDNDPRTRDGEGPEKRVNATVSTRASVGRQPVKTALPRHSSLVRDDACGKQGPLVVSNITATISFSQNSAQRKGKAPKTSPSSSVESANPSIPAPGNLQRAPPGREVKIRKVASARAIPRE